jgi:hypothetical protein
VLMSPRLHRVAVEGGVKGHLGARAAGAERRMDGRVVGRGPLAAPAGRRQQG